MYSFSNSYCGNKQQWLQSTNVGAIQGMKLHNLSRNWQSGKTNRLCRKIAILQSGMVPVCYHRAGEEEILLYGVIMKVSEKRKMWGSPRRMEKNIKRYNCRPGHLKHTLYLWCLGWFKWEDWERQMKKLPTLLPILLFIMPPMSGQRG